MAIAAGACPSCGAEVTFRTGASMALVCEHCKHVVVRSDRGLDSAGRVADVVFSDTALAPGDRGTFGGRSFEVMGRLVLQHPMGGTWEEYYAAFEGRPAWIEEAQGRWFVRQQVSVPVPPLADLAPGASIMLGAHGGFVVRERSHGAFLSAEGEVPFAPRPGAERVFVDLDGAGAASASIDFGDGSGEPRVYVGVQTTFDQLGVRRHGGVRPETHVDIREIKCPSCGAPQPLLAASKSERLACRYCGALSEIATQQVVARQAAARAQPALPLGGKATIEGTEWTVIGYVERSAVDDGETFSWQEYLLYEPAAGYRWIVVDEDVWRFSAPVSAADVDTSGLPRAIKHDGRRYALRNEGSARVDHVLGEFYWRVEVGEKVFASDFECGDAVLSREASGDEVNWALGAAIPTRAVAEAFGVALARPAAVDAALAVRRVPRAVALLLVFGVVVLFFALASLGDDSGGGGVRGTFFGGSGGK